MDCPIHPQTAALQIPNKIGQRVSVARLSGRISPFYAFDMGPEKASRVSGCRMRDKHRRKFLETATKTKPFQVRDGADSFNLQAHGSRANGVQT